MANNYVITSIVSLGDQATVAGTVNGTAVTIQTWLSVLTQQPNVTSLRNFLAPLMLAAAFPPVAIAVVSPNVTSVIGSFSQ